MDAQEIEYIVGNKENTNLIYAFDLNGLFLDDVIRHIDGKITGFFMVEDDCSIGYVRLLFNNGNLQKLEIIHGMINSASSTVHNNNMPSECILSSDEIERIKHKAKELNEFLEIVGT